MLSRGGFELNEIWAKQAQLVEADTRLRNAERTFKADPGETRHRERYVAELRRAGDHDAADHHELDHHVHAYQKAHAAMAKQARIVARHETGAPGANAQERRNARGSQTALMAKRNEHYKTMWNTANRHEMHSRGQEPGHAPFAERHEVGERIAKHLQPKHALDNDNLTHQVLDVHGHSIGGRGYGRDRSQHLFNIHAQSHVWKRPIEADAAHYDTRHSKSAKPEALKKNERLEALKRSLTHTGAGHVANHIANHHDMHSQDVVIHAFEINPAKPGEKIKHAEPHLIRHD